MNFKHIADFIAHNGTDDVDLYRRHVKACAIADDSGAFPLLTEWFGIYYAEMNVDYGFKARFIQRLKFVKAVFTGKVA